jgi:hypothetical protein
VSPRCDRRPHRACEPSPRDRLHPVVREGVKTTPEGIEAIKAFRRELSEAEQLRGKIAIRTREYAPVSVHYANALLALGRFWKAVGLAAMWPPDAQAPPFRLSEQLEKMQKAESDFMEEKARLIEAARRYFKPRFKGRLRRLWPSR